MSNVWTDEFPTIEGAFYWVRHKLNHEDLDVASLLNGSLYFTYGAPTSKSRRRDYEYLGPITPTLASDAAAMRDACVEKVKAAMNGIVACRPHSQLSDLMSQLIEALEQEK